MCGKNPSKVFHAFVESGSPPRVREKPNLVKVTKSNARITPACAGKTRTIQPFAELVRDHPRVCGKNLTLNISVLDSLGSPPRVREKLSDSNIQRMKAGITPACAGKTLRLPRFQQLGRDHPRVCGKNGVLSMSLKRDMGSPPRVREKPDEYGLYKVGEGITPACAGKTLKR